MVFHPVMFETTNQVKPLKNLPMEIVSAQLVQHWHWLLNGISDVETIPERVDPLKRKIQI